ncbi:MAG: hypothetical protein AAF633_08975 [Chloroflexota bacterium]
MTIIAGVGARRDGVFRVHRILAGHRTPTDFGTIIKDRRGL